MCSKCSSSFSRACFRIEVQARPGKAVVESGLLSCVRPRHFVPAASFPPLRSWRRALAAATSWTPRRWRPCCTPLPWCLRGPLLCNCLGLLRCCCRYPLWCRGRCPLRRSGVAAAVPYSLVAANLVSSLPRSGCQSALVPCRRQPSFGAAEPRRNVPELRISVQAVSSPC